jgi:hypothetical protein
MTILIKFLRAIVRWLESFTTKGPEGDLEILDLHITARTKSIATLEWGCAYAFPVRPEVSIPLVVVSTLYRSPRAQLEEQGNQEAENGDA